MGRLEVDYWHSIQLVGRGWWGAAPPKDTPKPLNHPITWVRYTYEHVRKNTEDINEALQGAQRLHMEEEEYNDIAYNFMIDKDGTVYEGRGWKTEAERPSTIWGLGGKCLDICYLGDFDNKDTQPTSEQFQAGFYLLLYGLKERFISPAYRNISFRDKYIPILESSKDETAFTFNFLND